MAIIALFGLVYAVMFTLTIWFFPFTDWGYFSLLIMVGFTLLMVLFQYGISPLIIRWIYRIDWMPYDQFVAQYPHLAETLNKVVSVQQIKMPRMGIIHDLNPNAFTFGWTKNSARIVLTDGILHYLNEKEQNAVLAHELGHVVHSDFILMTIVFAIPLILLTIARWAYYATLFGGRTSSRRSRSDSDETAYIYLIFIVVMVLSYVAYYIGFLISLIVSRIREYYADQHAAEVLEDPNALSTGLVKIAYGLISDQGLEIKERNKSKVRGVKGLGIFDPNGARAFAVSGMTTTGVYSKEAIQAAAAWDLYNPWAKYYQIFSTHPLPAKRIQRLNDQCALYGIKPELDFAKSKQIKEEQAGASMLDEFMVDLVVKNLPWTIFFLLIAFTVVWVIGIFFPMPIISGLSFKDMVLAWGIGFYIIAFGFILRTRFMYKSGFNPQKVVDLLTNVKVSPIRSVPAIIEGRIVGKGVPGYYFSDDLYFQDDTGLMYIDYRFGLSIVDFFWAITKVNKIIGQKVRIKGWYRRGPAPYFQVDTIESEMGKRWRNYSKHMTYIWAVLAFIIGLIIIFFWFQIPIV